MTDAIGQEIMPGSIIAYPVMICDSTAIRIGKVVKVQSKPHPYVCDRVEFRITVHGTERHWRNENALSLMSKKSTLQFPDRCVVLDWSKLSDDYKALFDTVPA